MLGFVHFPHCDINLNHTLFKCSAKRLLLLQSLPMIWATTPLTKNPLYLLSLLLLGAFDEHKWYLLQIAPDTFWQQGLNFHLNSTTNWKFYIKRFGTKSFYSLLQAFLFYKTSFFCRSDVIWDIMMGWDYNSDDKHLKCKQWLLLEQSMIIQLHPIKAK